MKHYCRHVQGWFLWVDIYKNRTQWEAHMGDFMECTFQPGMTLKALKRRVESELARLPPSVAAGFRVEIRPAGTITFSGPMGTVPFYRLHLAYKTRRVISISEPTDKNYHAERGFKNLH